MSKRVEKKQLKLSYIDFELLPFVWFYVNVIFIVLQS